ncbi:hypothetical protein DESPIG_02242 [Desulfovibrio piger ATCC 29098]|uniref:Uncharacterized protein n=1 Tax=Desulfovibrio piger ATCC 29098 TaxID=411464 RepID=B6WVX4_9BACT|nr:hypothetical protein DESPIG_02242 [Desulfovibrio piger ATCC 29098]
MNNLTKSQPPFRVFHGNNTRKMPHETAIQLICHTKSAENFLL